MSSDRFIHERKKAWQRLEDLLAMLDRSSLRRLHREEVRELGRIYRRTASDLAIARAESRDPRLVNYLNSLVIRAHGRIYRADAQGGRRIRDFFTRGFPQTFRRTWRYTALAFAAFFLLGLVAFIGTRVNAGALGLTRRPTGTFEDPATVRFISSAQLSRIAAALDVYRLEKGEVPSNLDALVEVGLLRGEDLRYPWRDTYYYRRVAPREFVLLPPLR